MQQHHGWSIDSLEDMVPFERQIYVDLLLKHLEALEQKRRGY